jgi:hypothetical protein
MYPSPALIYLSTFYLFSALSLMKILKNIFIMKNAIFTGSQTGLKSIDTSSV